MIIRQDKVIFGVCGGLAKAFGLDVVLIRVVFSLLLVCYGFGAGIYLLSSFILPDKESLSSYPEPKISGVCLYFSKKHNIDLILLRYVVAILGIFMPMFLFVYFITGFCIPKE